jgi:divalent metal cation (Fe/Co/Zn/Cd) transporter
MIVLIYILTALLLAIKGIFTGITMHSPETVTAYYIFIILTLVVYGVYLYLRYFRRRTEQN